MLLLGGVRARPRGRDARFLVCRRGAEGTRLATASRKELIVADPVPAGSDVSSGTYRCTNCGYELQVTSTQHLPPCASCGNGSYDTVTGGDSVDDPYPSRA